MKRLLLIEIDAGEVVCGKCDWHDSKGEACSMFNVFLTDGMVRHFQCTKAEDDARLKLRTKEEDHDAMA